MKRGGSRRRSRSSSKRPRPDARGVGARTMGDIPGAAGAGDLGRVVKRPRKKRIRLPKQGPLDQVCGMPLSLWKMLIFPRLDAADLALLIQTCRAFAGYADMKRWISERCKAAFGTLHKRHWNRIGKYRIPNKLKNSPLYALIDIPSPLFFAATTGAKRLDLCAFSSKERLLEHLFRMVPSQYIHPNRHVPRPHLVFIMDRITHSGKRVDYMYIARREYTGFPQELDNVRTYNLDWYKWFGIEPMDIYRYRHLVQDPRLSARLDFEAIAETYDSVPRLALRAGAHANAAGDVDKSVTSATH